MTQRGTLEAALPKHDLATNARAGSARNWLAAIVELLWKNRAEAAARALVARETEATERWLHRARVLIGRGDACLRGLGLLRTRSVRVAALLYGAALRAAARAMGEGGSEACRMASFSAQRVEVGSWSPREARARTRRLRRLANASSKVAAARVEAIGRILLWRIGCCVVLGALLVGGLSYGYESWRRASNLLENSPWRASSALLQCKPLAEGGCGPQRSDVFFHTLQEVHPWIEFGLGKKVTLRELQVDNASSYGERAVPLVVEVSDDRKTWREVSRRKTGFRTWHTYIAPVSARYLRLSVPRETFLHLKRVQAWSG